MSIRLRRLQADYETIRKELQHSPYIHIRAMKGDPPERYEIEYHVKGLMLQEDGEIVESNKHIAEITLTREYPRRQPQCKMLTPIFHPNVDPGAICIADHWAPSESLADLIVRIAQIIAYQDYNTKSPLDGEAARWADENRQLLPIDAADLVPTEAKPEAPGPWIGRTEIKPQVKHCENCGISSTEMELVRCAGGHLACPDCLIECEKCGATLCLLCEVGSCGICGATGCGHCLGTCPLCERKVCNQHLLQCEECGKSVCQECASTCSDCGRALCKNDLTYCNTCKKPLCRDCAAECELCPSGTGHHRGELARCKKCEALVCQEHLHTSAISGVAICDSCGTICSACGKWVTNEEASKCSICGKLVCETCATICPICKKTICLQHAVVCDICNRVVCEECSFRCRTCGKTLCRIRSHAAKCSVCGKLFCHECLKECPECNQPVCPEHTLHCSSCGGSGCRHCMTVCPFCKRIYHTRHMTKCELCARKVCLKCLKTCSRCGAKACPEHFYKGLKLCIPCFQRRDKLMAIWGSAALAIGILLLVILILILYWLL